MAYPTSEFSPALKKLQRRMMKRVNARGPSMRCPVCVATIPRVDFLAHLELDQDHQNFYWDVIKLTPTASKLQAMENVEAFIGAYGSAKRKKSTPSLRMET